MHGTTQNNLINKKMISKSNCNINTSGDVGLNVIQWVIFFNLTTKLDQSLPLLFLSL